MAQANRPQSPLQHRQLSQRRPQEAQAAFGLGLGLLNKARNNRGSYSTKLLPGESHASQGAWHGELARAYEDKHTRLHGALLGATGFKNRKTRRALNQQVKELASRAERHRELQDFHHEKAAELGEDDIASTGSRVKDWALRHYMRRQRQKAYQNAHAPLGEGEGGPHDHGRNFPHGPERPNPHEEHGAPHSQSPAQNHSLEHGHAPTGQEHNHKPSEPSPKLFYGKHAPPIQEGMTPEEHDKLRLHHIQRHAERMDFHEGGLAQAHARLRELSAERARLRESGKLSPQKEASLSKQLDTVRNTAAHHKSRLDHHGQQMQSQMGVPPKGHEHAAFIDHALTKRAFGGGVGGSGASSGSTPGHNRTPTSTAGAGDAHRFHQAMSPLKREAYAQAHPESALTHAHNGTNGRRFPGFTPGQQRAYHQSQAKEYHAAAQASAYHAQHAPNAFGAAMGNTAAHHLTEAARRHARLGQNPNPPRPHRPKASSSSRRDMPLSPRGGPVVAFAPFGDMHTTQRLHPSQNASQTFSGHNRLKGPASYQNPFQNPLRTMRRALSHDNPNRLPRQTENKLRPVNPLRPPAQNTAQPIKPTAPIKPPPLPKLQPKPPAVPKAPKTLIITKTKATTNTRTPLYMPRF